jgi:hypothetical protein
MFPSIDSTGSVSPFVILPPLLADVQWVIRDIRPEDSTFSGMRQHSQQYKVNTLFCRARLSCSTDVGDEIGDNPNKVPLEVVDSGS